jgi:hypothetical protein
MATLPFFSPLSESRSPEKRTKLDHADLPPKPTDPQLPTPMANADSQPTSSDDIRCHFFKLSLELRDNIYDYVAYGEKELGLYVNLENVTEPKTHVYDRGLSHTCAQLRQEYMLRLQRRVKQIDIDHRTHVDTHSIMARNAFATLLIAERKVSRNAWVQDHVAFRWIIPFEGMFDDGQRRSTLRFTVASGATRAFDKKIGLPARRMSGESTGDMISAMTSLQRLKNVAEYDVRNWWMSLWNAYEVRLLYYKCYADDDILGEGRWFPSEFMVR